MNFYKIAAYIDVFVLLHHFVKKTRKTPKREIECAKRKLEDFKERGIFYGKDMERGLTQAELAELCKVKQPAIARLETGGHSPRIDSLLKVLGPLGYTLQIVPMKRG